MRAKAILLCAFLIISVIGAGATSYKTIYSFTNWYDGENPYPGVIIDQSGNLYGVAPWSEITEGTIFRLTPSQDSWSFDVLHTFWLRDPDGTEPIGGLVMDEAGNLYGTTSYYDGPLACGTVFKLSPSEGFTVLHYFTFNDSDGCDPENTLSYSSGWLWGTTRSGA